MKDIRGDPTDQSALDRVLDYVRVKSTVIKSRLDALVPRDPIEGIFKVYITFKYQSNFQQMLKILRKKFYNTEYQLAIIQTNIYSKNGESSQLIAIRSYRGEYPSIIPVIEKEVHEDFAGFDIVGITVKSLVSNIGVPINDIDTKLFWNEQINCFEFHYQLSPNQLYPK
ncbi:unnamed protein product, partial [Rotaria sp. Silwood2]